MEFFEKAKQTLSVAGKELGQKANEFSAVAKLTLKIRESEKRLQDAYGLLGRQILEEDEELARKIAPDMVLYIHQKMEEIAELKEQVEAVKTEVVTEDLVEDAEITVLSEPVDAETTAVSETETEEEAETEEVEEVQMKTCPACGNKIQSDDSVCIYCGMKL